MLSSGEQEVLVPQLSTATELHNVGWKTLFNLAMLHRLTVAVCSLYYAGGV